MSGPISNRRPSGLVAAALAILVFLGASAVPATASPSDTPGVAALPPVLDGDDRWGFNVVPADGHAADLARNAGARWNRLVFAWDSIEPSRGQLLYQAADNQVNASEQAGISIEGVLIGAPPWAKDPHTQMPSGLYRDWNDPKNLWAQFVRQTVTRYGSDIRYWEIWNEPDDTSTFFPGSPIDYYQVLKIAYQVVKANNASAKVILAGLAYWPNPDFLPDLLRNMVNDPTGAAHHNYFDILALHSYARPTDVPDRVEWARRYLAPTVGDRPIWLNETNVAAWDVSTQNAFHPFEWSASTSEQASYIIQTLAYAVATGVDKVMVYRLQNVGEPINYALIGQDASLYPGYVAYQLATRYFSHVTAGTVARQGDVEQVVLRRPGQRVVVVWNRTSGPITARIGAQTATALAVDQAGASRFLQAVEGQYRLDLASATANNGPSSDDYLIGGKPFILVESFPPNQQSDGAAGSLIAYSGDWQYFARDGANPSFRLTSTVGASAAVEFEGSTVTWTTTKGPDQGIARVAVDELPQGEIDLRSDNVVHQVPLTFGPFSSGRHRLTITVAGRAGGGTTDRAVELVGISASKLYATWPLPPPPRPSGPPQAATSTAVPSASLDGTADRLAAPLLSATDDPPAAGSPVVALPLLFKHSDGWSTSVDLQNLGDDEAQVSVQYRALDGNSTWEEEVTIEPGDVATLDLADESDLPEGFTGSALVSSGNDQPLTPS